MTYESSKGRTVASIYFDSAIVALGLIYLAYYILKYVNARDRRARARLRREKLFRSTLTSLGDAVIVTDKCGLVTFLNPKAERLMGIQLLHARGQHVDKVFFLYDEATLEPITNSVSRIIEYGGPNDLEGDAFLKDSYGNLIPIKDNATLIRDSQDRLLGAVLVFRDATRERQARKLYANADGIALSPVLLANASRKIDAPLVAACDLIYFAKLNENIPTDASDLLTLAEGHLGQVSHISREILGFYIQSEPFEQIDLSTLIDSVLRTFSNRFHSKSITAVRDFQPCPSVSGLSGELNQVITNLISNAFDAVPSGGTIRAQLSRSGSEDGKVLVLSIGDNGPGIVPANRDHLFEPFFTTKGSRGYGLGLWTSKRIIERHGGSIQVEYGDHDSVTGTIFNVLLPIMRSNSSTQEC
jgi:PAS domain S-box-containing protein